MGRGWTEAPVVAAGSAKSPLSFIHSPLYDLAFFLLSPLLGLLLYCSLIGVRSAPGGSLDLISVGIDFKFVAIFGALITQSHIFLVLYRSHLNPRVFSQYRFRFTGVPLLLFVASFGSDFVYAILVTVAFFFDIYHSSKQTFGVGRIYEMKAGLHDHSSRGWDIWLNHLLYIGPLLGGLNLLFFLDGLAPLHPYFPSGLSFLKQLLPYRPALKTGIGSAGVLFLMGYVLRVWRARRRGHRVAWLKLVLYFSTGAVSVYTWTFLPFPLALLIVNFYHAMQYFGVVWWAERETMIGRVARRNRAYSTQIALLTVVVPCLVYAALWVRYDETGFGRVAIVLSNLHFWYDGFIWSVRRGQIKA